MATTVSTNILITDILAGEALNLYGSTHPHAIAIREMIKDANGDINLENSLVRGMLALLIADGVLTQAVVDRVNAEIEKQTPSYQDSQYDVSNVDGNVIEWINQNKIPSDAVWAIQGDIVTLMGELPSPARRIS